MNGPGHYREAEVLIGQVTDAELTTAKVEAYMAVAQVHATLALAAATAEFHGLPAGIRAVDRELWKEALS